ncbi:hypothetical protein QJQ45_006993 [Haematococcus lacustris]|nr:hypothetical protein QJQ45_006993 [Haematococcus lacustris]
MSTACKALQGLLRGSERTHLDALSLLCEAELNWWREPARRGAQAVRLFTSVQARRPLSRPLIREGRAFVESSEQVSRTHLEQGLAKLCAQFLAEAHTYSVQELAAWCDICHHCGFTGGRAAQPLTLTVAGCLEGRAQELEPEQLASVLWLLARPPPSPAAQPPTRPSVPPQASLPASPASASHTPQGTQLATPPQAAAARAAARQQAAPGASQAFRTALLKARGRSAGLAGGEAWVERELAGVVLDCWPFVPARDQAVLAQAARHLRLADLQPGLQHSLDLAAPH